MRKIKKSYRLSQKTLNQIDFLVNQASKQLSEFDELPTSADIIEDAVAAYYIQKIDNAAGDPYLSKIESMLRDEFQKYFDPFIDNANTNLFNILKNQELLNLITARLQFPDSLSEKRKMVMEQNPFDGIIEEKIYSKINAKGVNENEKQN